MKLKSWMLAGMAFVAAASLADTAADGTRWWSYVEYLASDKLEGRNTGSEGHRAAAEYVAAHFEHDGLKPAGEQGYIQPVKFKTFELDESNSSLSLERDGREQVMQFGKDAYNQPVDKQAAANYNILMERLIERVANEDARPAWKENSFFRRYALR